MLNLRLGKGYSTPYRPPLTAEVPPPLSPSRASPVINMAFRFEHATPLDTLSCGRSRPPR